MIAFAKNDHKPCPICAQLEKVADRLNAECEAGWRATKRWTWFYIGNTVVFMLAVVARACLVSGSDLTNSIWYWTGFAIWLVTTRFISAKTTKLKEERRVRGILYRCLLADIRKHQAGVNLAKQLE